MVWEKKNLVTQKDKTGYYDKWGCSICKYESKYYGMSIGNKGYCPKCKGHGKKKKDKTIYAFWGRKENKSKCQYCKSRMKVVPRKGHRNSHFWEFEKDDGLVLLTCPAKCSEDGSFVGKRRLKRRKQCIGLTLNT